MILSRNEDFDNFNVPHTHTHTRRNTILSNLDSIGIPKNAALVCLSPPRVLCSSRLLGGTTWTLHLQSKLWMYATLLLYRQIKIHLKFTSRPTSLPLNQDDVDDGLAQLTMGGEKERIEYLPFERWYEDHFSKIDAELDDGVASLQAGAK